MHLLRTFSVVALRHFLAFCNVHQLLTLMEHYKLTSKSPALLHFLQVRQYIIKSFSALPPIIN